MSILNPTTNPASFLRVRTDAPGLWSYSVVAITKRGEIAAFANFEAFGEALDTVEAFEGSILESKKTALADNLGQTVSSKTVQKGCQPNSQARWSRP